jgi:cobalt-zinc-cadmium resistance protein CzcA
LPEFNLAYYNMTMKGSGADNVVYTFFFKISIERKLGLGIPLFFGSQKAKINASKINQNIADKQLCIRRKEPVYKININLLLSKHQSNLETAVNYFESTGS